MQSSKCISYKLSRFLWATIFIFCITCLSCEEEAKTPGPCEGFKWGSANIDGREVCFENIRFTYKNPNTDNAYIQLLIYDGLIGQGESINAFFSIPSTGLELNKNYAAYDGDYFESEDIESGSLTLLYYDGTSKDMDQKYTHGTFVLKTKNPNNPNASSNITGEFKYKF